MPTTAPHPRRPADPPATGPIQVFCADPYPLARDGVAHLARRYPDLAVAGGAGTVAAALAALEQRPALVDVVLVGDDLPEGGRGLLVTLRTAYPDLGLVLISHRWHDLWFPRARVAGASGFVSQGAPVTAVVAAIRHAAADPRSFRTFGVSWAVARAAETTRRLSPRERQVLALLAEGHRAEDIATTLRVGRATVRTYMSRLYAKLDVSNRAQALVAAAGQEPTATR